MTTRTAIGWSPRFAAHAAVTAAGLDGFEFLPNRGWDTNERVQCLRDTLSQPRLHLPGVWVREQLVSAGRSDLAEFHSADYLRGHGVPGQPRDERVAAALLGAGAVLELCELVWTRAVANAYALVRPAGHHSLPTQQGGGCVFANGVLAARRARQLGARRVLMVDWDAHHGNSQQTAFWDDPTVLTISIHQARAYAPQTGGMDARGGGPGLGTTLNVPVPMGSGGGVYRRVLTEVVERAADRFRPDMVIVLSGLDANYQDPSARLALHSGDFGWMTARMVDVAERHAGGRLLMTHEGGYAPHFIPLCFLRIVEALSGVSTGVADPFLVAWGEDFAADVPAEAEGVVAAGAALAARVPAARDG